MNIEPSARGLRAAAGRARQGVIGLAWVLAGTLAASAAWAAPEARVIVGFKDDAPTLRTAAAAGGGATAASSARVREARAALLSSRLGTSLVAGRALGERMQVLRAAGLSSEALAAQLAADPDVAWAEPDRRRRASRVPNDPLYGEATRTRGPDAGQWYLRPPTATLKSAANFQQAWDRRVGGAGTVVAVIDTGVRPDHPDLNGVLLPGIDAIDDIDTANDGNGPDTDPSDPGDWVSAAENNQSGGPFQDCGASSSSWHGTLVSTLVAAVADDATGMAGSTFGGRVLPVRVLGKCGGWDSDIIAGMLWAAGLEPVAGVMNSHPAQVLNLSLGGSGSCTRAYENAVARVNAAGAVVVAAAGNDAGLPVGVPANCQGVIGVGGLRHAGSKVGFSDLGPEIAISAPGGNCVNTGAGEPCLYPILAGTNTGTRAPLAGGSTWTDSYDASYGTSFATPLVAGAAALVMSQRPTLSPSQVLQVLQASARAFPQTGADNGDDPTPVPVCVAPTDVEQLQCYCPNPGQGVASLCGAGMLDAAAALAAAEDGIAQITLETDSPTAGHSITVSAADSLSPQGHSIAGYRWTLVDGGGIVSGFSGSNTAREASLLASGAGSFTLRLTLTDDQGGTLHSDDFVVSVAAGTDGGGGGGSSGGGALGFGWLLGLALAARILRRA